MNSLEAQLGISHHLFKAYIKKYKWNAQDIALQISHSNIHLELELKIYETKKKNVFNFIQFVFKQCCIFLKFTQFNIKKYKS